MFPDDLRVGQRSRPFAILGQLARSARPQKLETVVTLQYRVEEKENGLKSKFEIK